MQGNTLQRHARNRVEKLPSVSVEHPFGPSWNGFNVHSSYDLADDRHAGQQP